MALLDPYCTVAEADVFLSTSTTWLTATTSQKELALFWGRMWIDSNFRCSDLIADSANPSEQIKFANALLAEDYLEGTLTGSNGQFLGDSGIKRKRSKAGDVEEEIEYFEGGEEFIDYQADVKTLLSTECSFISAGMRLLQRN